jgi:hypothetical protein
MNVLNNQPMIKIFKKVIFTKVYLAISAIAKGFRAFLVEKRSEILPKICFNNIRDGRISINLLYFVTHLTQLPFLCATEMNTISKEKSFEESNEITSIVILKEKLENIIQLENLSNIEFQEECNEVVATIVSINNIEKIEYKSKEFYKVSDKIKFLINKYSNILTEESYKSLNKSLINLNLAGDLGIATSKIKEGLSEKSSRETLQQWANWTEAFVEFLEINQDILTLERSQDLTELAENIIAITFIKHPHEKSRNKLKRSLKYSATFLLNIARNWNIKNGESIDKLQHAELERKVNLEHKSTWTLRVGEKSYEELLLESQKRIHLLNDLMPKTEEEVKYQTDTLNCLKEELEWNID